jgi:hypothetical protein
LKVLVAVVDDSMVTVHLHAKLAQKAAKEMACAHDPVRVQVHQYEGVLADKFHDQELEHVHEMMVLESCLFFV